jgi:hypothetical protein
MRHLRWGSVPATLAVGVALAINPVAPSQQPPDQPEQPQGVEVMARGPVHEAYAEPVDARPEASPVVPRKPPDPVAEAPPDQKPEGDNIVWIPGYWAWDDDSKGFLWVSGFWRNLPPDRQWVPGHWDEVEGGWQWVPGFWTSPQQEQVEYLPQPPASIDAGPSTPAPDDTSTYVPGCWVFQQTRYLWRPGFWMPYHEGWCWQPAHYHWSPAGCVFVEGYWDHPLEERGLLFAPVQVDFRAVDLNRWSYVPSFVVQPDFLLGALFVRPRWHSYYFGDYFEPRYEQRGFVPWIDYRVGRYAPDPIFAYYRQTYRDTPQWARGLRDLYVGRREDRIPRPPQTWTQQREVIGRVSGKTTDLQTVTALMPLNRADTIRVTGLAALAGDHRPPGRHAIKLESVPREQQVRLRKEAEQFHAVAQQRHQTEARLRSQEPAGRPPEHPRAAKLELPRPPAPAERTRPNVKTPPPPPQLPRHEERPAPRTEPPRRETTPPQPRREATPPREPAPRPPEPPRAEPPAPPRREPPPPEPRREPPRAEPPAPPRREAPPPQPAPRPPEPRREVIPPRAEPPAPPRQERPPEPAPRPPAPRPPERAAEPPRPQPPAPHRDRDG